jgi:ribosomal protein S18 acetylase RimI-like enzyme
VQATGVIRGGPDVTLRFLRLDRETRKRHPHYDHWYLWFLGVDPERQGQGIGSVLLRSLSAKAEASGVPCYLETDKLSSVRIYERHGYVVHSEEVFPNFDLRIWFMNRPEKKPRSASMGPSEQG